MSKKSWKVAETYPIEGFYQTQILEGGEVACIATGYNRSGAAKRAAMIVEAVNRVNSSSLPSHLRPKKERCLGIRVASL